MVTPSVSRQKDFQVIIQPCFVFIIGLLLVLMPFLGSKAAAGQFKVDQISDGTGSPNAPRLNNFGHVVWYGPDGSSYNDWEIYFYDGTTVHQITNNIYDDESPDINDSDQIVWLGRDGTSLNIYQANGVSIPTIVAAKVGGGVTPRINDYGDVVWHAIPAGQSDYEIFLYEGGLPLPITSNSYDDFTPDINDNGVVVWTSKIDNSTYKLFKDSAEIYSGSRGANNPRINNQGNVVWSRYDYDYEIFQYKNWDNTITNISLNSAEDVRPAINNNDFVVWDGGPYAAHSTYLYENMAPARVIPDTLSDARNADINDKNQVVWSGWNGTYDAIYLATPKIPNIYTFEYHYDGGAGDYYRGRVTAFPDYGYNLGKKWFTEHEGGSQGYYLITGVTAGNYFDADRVGRVDILNYHDQETETDFEPNSYKRSMAASFQYLGKEYDWILADYVDNFKFGEGFYEADPTGTTYLVYQQWGGTWHDANKSDTSNDDDKMCWAATAANVLKWGFWDTNPYDTSPAILQYFLDHWTNMGGLAHEGWRWWLQGTPPAPGGSQIDVPGGGNFWTEFNQDDYIKKITTTLLPTMDQLFQAGYGVSAGIENLNGDGHSITVWGFDYYTSGATRGYAGLWVTDSDDYDHDPGLFYVPLIWDNLNKWYNLGGDYQSWFLVDFEALKINSTPVVKYSYTYLYGNGDYYTGEIYGKNGDFAVEVDIPKKNELGLTGHYDITAREFSADFDKLGQVFINSYHDGESGLNFTPLHRGLPVGQLLGNEQDYILWNGMAIYLCGRGYWEADVGDRYTFRYYYNGNDKVNSDSYQGVVYRAIGDIYYPGWKSGSKVNETGKGGYYEILAMSYTGEVSKYGQVFVDWYQDGDGGKCWFRPVNYTAALGKNYLGSEAGFIKKAGSTEYKFGQEYWEADAGDTFSFTYYFGDGDVFLGKVYYPATSSYYYLGWETTPTKNETGQEGYYRITGVSYTGDASKYGQVYVDWYQDGDGSKAWVRPVNYNAALGKNYLGSEVGFIKKEGIPEYKFGQRYYEADAGDTFSFSYYYGNGDLYTGRVYYPTSSSYYYLGWQSAQASNETGQAGYYKITEVSFTGDASKYGQVLVDWYQDGDGGKAWFRPVNYTSALGKNYLGSEVGFIKKDGIPEYKFGQRYWEADAGDTFSFTYYYGNGDVYLGKVYYPVTCSYYYLGWQSELRVNETGQKGYYRITGASYTGDAGKYGQVYVDWYQDGDGSKAWFRPVNYTAALGTNYLMSETGYIKTLNTPGYRFGQGWYEADEK